jgi:hypothetical protein
MNRRDVLAGGGLALALAAVLAGQGGCLPSVFLNQTKQRTGNITFQFVNNTPYTAVFSYGTYDAWDNTPGAASLEQLRLAPNTSSSPTSVTCRRNAVVGTQDFLDRVLLIGTENFANFDPDAFSAVVQFSSAPTGSSAAGLPTAGTAQGQNRLLGVDYSCADQLVFKFFVDPDAPGGFRIDFDDILDKPANQ